MTGDLGSYYEGRFSEELRWYERRSKQNKRAFLVLRGGVVAVAAAIPVALQVADDPKLAGSLMSALIVVAEGILALFQCHEHWINYRSTAEMMKKEGELFKSQIGDYAAAEDSNSLFVERIEALVSREHTFWKTTAKRSRSSPRE